MDRGDGVTATDDGGGAAAGGGGDGLGHFERALGESRHFEYAHGTVPDDGLGGGNFLAIGVDGLGTDVQAHPTVGGSGNRNRLRRRVGFEFGTDDVIDRQEKSEFFFLRFFTQAPREVKLVVFNERLADGLAFGFEKSVGHAAADEHGIGNFHEVFDDFDFVADLGAAKNRDKGARGIGDRFAEIGEFLFHEQAGGGLLDEAGDADYGSMRAMRGAKGITDEKAVTESRELFRKGLVVLFLLGMEADVFEQEDIAVGECFALRLRNGPDTVRGKSNRPADEFLELLGYLHERVFRIWAALGAAQMRSEHQSAALLNREAERGERFANAGVVGDHTVFERNVEVHADEDALSAKIEIVDGQLVHSLGARYTVVSLQ